MEMEMLAVWAALAAIFSAAIFSARHVVLASIVAGKAGWMDGVLPLIGSKSKPSLSSPATAGQSEGRSDGSHLKARYLKVTAATADIREGISSLFIQVFPFFPSDLSLQSTLFFFLFTPSLLSCSFSLSDSADVSRVRRCDLNLGRNPEAVFYCLEMKA